MLHFLFRRLTGRPPRGKKAFDHAVSEARQRAWYADAGVPDTLEGRFAVLATVCALKLVRLESYGDDGRVESAALTERFVEAMDVEHRQMGMNDPALGKKVRRLVGSLARRVEEWRAATGGNSQWDETVRSSLYTSTTPDEAQLACASQRLRSFWSSLSGSESRLTEEDSDGR